MHNLALALHEKGDRITGSDDAIFEPSKSRLEAVGLLPESLGWFPWYFILTIALLLVVAR